jgi:hypothetical protein
MQAPEVPSIPIRAHMTEKWRLLTDRRWENSVQKVALCLHNVRRQINLRNE